jgi:MFS family permease
LQHRHRRWRRQPIDFDGTAIQAYGDLMNTSTPSPQQPFPPVSAAWYATGVFLLAATLGFIDKSIITLLVQPIRHSLMISDTQVSLLQGFSFALIYGVLGLPAGYLTDKYRRREMLACGVAIWSVATAACGLASSFGELFMARVGVGLGEAILMPAIYSMLADFFPPKMRGRAAGIFTISTFVGGQGAFIVGGMVLKALHGDSLQWPVLGELQAWQSAFIIVGLPGLLIAPLVLTVREPARQLGRRKNGVIVADIDETTSSFLSKRRSLWTPLLICFSMTAFSAFALLAWLPTFFIRKYGIPASSAGVLIGSVMGPAGIIGCVAAGAISDYFRSRRGESGRLDVLIMAAIICIPCMAFLPFAADTGSALAICAVYGLFNAMATAAMPAILQGLAPNRLRGKLTAIHLLLVSLVGMGLGPLVVALITDRGFHSDAALPYSLALTIAPGLSIALVAALFAKRAARLDSSEDESDAVATNNLPRNPVPAA